MSNYHQVVDRWVDIVMGRTTKQNLSNPRMFGSGDRIYSYGHHFELGRLLRDNKQKPLMFLLNGDRFSVTTTRHQGEVRRGVQREGLPVVIIPFSALEAAGIDFDTVELIDETGDRWETIKHETYEKPPRAVWDEIPQYKYNDDMTADELAAKVAERNERNRKEWEERKGWAETDEPDGYHKQWLERHPEPKQITVEDLGHWERVITRLLGHKKVLRSAPGSHHYIDVETLPDGHTRYSWETSRHWLGESLIRAKVPRTGFTTCKTCNGTGLTGPDPVEAFWATDDDRFSDEKWSKSLRAAEKWRRELRCPTCHGRRGRNWTRNRTAYFLSGFDHNEPQPVYFFCELPQKVNPTSIAEAYEDLKPEPVKLAELMGRNVHRQGDIFAIELRDTTKAQLRKQGARFEKRGNLLDTNHEATEVAYLPNGTTLVRGTLWHNPAWRDPDHRRVTVGKNWHIAIKNTVPVAI